MIIVEGPDGSGKTMLLETLMAQYPSIPLHDRASRSGPDGGPVDDLYGWAMRDIRSWRDDPVQFYDRHPLVSEYIYGPIIRGSVDYRFLNTPYRRFLERRALTIVCLPPLEAVRSSVSAERDMLGVVAHIDAIWTLYASLSATWSAGPGLSLITYDWTTQDPSVLFPHINSHRIHWSVTR